jgi:hypothetical protein
LIFAGAAASASWIEAAVATAGEGESTQQGSAIAIGAAAEGRGSKNGSIELIRSLLRYTTRRAPMATESIPKYLGKVIGWAAGTANPFVPAADGGGATEQPDIAMQIMAMQAIVQRSINALTPFGFLLLVPVCIVMAAGPI